MSINEPFALATYNNLLHASAGEDSVSVAVQSDGVHVLQLSTLRPIISHTLGPSTIFTCSPLTVSNSHTYTIYAAIKSSPELGDEQAAGKTIWVWSENLSSKLIDRAEAHKKKISVTVPHIIVGLYGMPELPEHIIALSPNGAVTVLQTSSLEAQVTWEPQGTSASNALLRAFVYPRAECSFLPPRASLQTGAVVVLILSDSETDNARVEVICIANEEREYPFAPIGSSQMNFKQSDIVDVSCSSSGHMSILTGEGEWSAFTLDASKGQPFALLQAADPFRLKNSPFAIKSVSLLPLTSSHVLLAAVLSSTSEITIQIWDLQYSVALASHALSIPSSFASSPTQSISIVLVSSTSSSAHPSASSAREKASLTNSQALLIISSSSSPMNKVPNTKSKSKSRTAHSSAPRPSIVFVLPCVVPRVSTIVNAIGRGSASAQWIALPENEGNTNGGLDKGRRDVLKTMVAAMEGNRPQAANEAFFEWEKSQKASGKKVTYGHDFVEQVLDAVLRPTKNPAGVMYSSEVIRHLINRKAVSDTMVEGGLIRVLKAKNDWVSIKLALMNVLDVSESELVEALWDVVIANHGDQQVHPDLDGMQVDDPSNPPIVKSSDGDVPSLPIFLGYCVKYRTTPTHLHLGFRQMLLQSTPSGMTAAESAVDILHVLIGWIEDWTHRDVPLLPAAVRKRNDGPWVAETENVKNIKNDEIEIPDLRQIVSFARTFLDATFLTLLQHKPAQKLLRRLVSLLEQEIAFTEAVQPLYGALDGFSRAHSGALREAEAKGDKHSASRGVSSGQEPQEDWRRRKKRLREQSMAAIGLYQVEELVL